MTEPDPPTDSPPPPAQPAKPTAGPARLSTASAVSLALPVGLGTLMFAIGFALGLAYLAGFLAVRLADPGIKPPAPPPVAVGMGIGALVFGFGLGSLARWARLGTVALGLLLLVVHLLLLLTNKTPLTGGALLGIVALGLLHPAVGRWFEDASVPLQPEQGLKAYRAAVAWLALVTVALLFVVPAFDKMFQETGIKLPWLTERVIGLSRFLAGPAALFPLVILAPVPLLRLAEPQAKSATWAAHAVGLLAFAVVTGSLVHALWNLIEML